MVLPKYVYFLPFFFSVSAFILACFVGASCHYLQFTSIDAVSNTVSGESKPISLQFGYWYYQSWVVANSTVTEGSCDIYPQSINIDKNWKAARVFNLIAIIIGASVLLLDMFQGCMSTKRNRSFRTGAVGYLICCISSGLSLIILHSNMCKNNSLIEQLNQLEPIVQFEEKCSISQGGKGTIAATVLWFFAAVGTALLHPVHKKQEQNEHDGLDEPLFNDNGSVI